MSPLKIAELLVRLSIRIIDLRMEHYKENPELRRQDAANAAILGKWGMMLLKAIDRLFAELAPNEKPPSSAIES